MAETAAAMAATLAHRGPNDEGTWTDPAGIAAFGFKRLSIIDLSPAGHQPMVSGNGRYALVFNGEVYNFRELREELEQKGHAFRGHADSEVVLHACIEWGVDAAVRRFNGMFAFVFWDTQQRRLWLVRDRMGVKPLYWLRRGPLILFGSELKALRSASGWSPELNREALSAFLRFGYCPAPHTVYSGVRKLLPGHILSVTEDALTEVAYWSLADAASRGPANPESFDETEAEERLDALLRSAVRLRLVADVPVGAFLSAGIDSSTVVAMMQQTGGTRPAQSFTVGFDDASFDESKRARAIATHLETEHSEIMLRQKDAIELIPNLPEWYDEPFADASQIPTALVSRFARTGVTVSLSGDGGDELFGGYERYTSGADLWRKIERVPKPLRGALAAVLRGVPVEGWNRILSVLPGRWRPNSGGEALHWFAEPLGREPVDLYRQMVSLWTEPGRIMPGIEEAVGDGWLGSPAEVEGNMHDLMPYLDGVTYLPDDILTKVDRASMAFGLEVREPLLDYRLVEFSWTLPEHMKVRDGKGKWLLRKVLARYVPTNLTEQPKKGFALPIGDWLRGPLRSWAEDLLHDHSTNGGLLDLKGVGDCWNDHLKGSNGREAPIWAVLMLQSWRRRWQI